MRIPGSGLFHFCAVLLGVWGLFGCSDRPESAQISGDVEVRLPWPDSKGQYSLQLVHLRGLHNLQEVRGSVAEFIYAPKIEGQKISGERPRARFMKTKEGFYVPEDETSQQMAALYAHVQRLQDLDQQTGVASLMSWPRTVGIAVRMRDQGEVVLNNSFYDGNTDSILMVPYKADSMPLALNGGVIAHEHFHAIFHHLVTGPLSEKGLLDGIAGFTAHDEIGIRDLLMWPRIGHGKGNESDRETLHTLLLKALNEGMADLWGWIYTGDPQFVQNSLPSQKMVRTLNLPKVAKEPKPLPPSEMLKGRIRGFKQDEANGAGALQSFAYVVGTSFSRVLKDVFSTSKNGKDAENPSAALGIKLVRALPALQKTFESSWKTQDLELQELLTVILNGTEDLDESQCQRALRWLDNRECQATAKAGRFIVRDKGVVK